ncbi:MAG TPA: NUDIX domain-containing protein [Candidatus Paceibacterota bacterium]|nr:NUDIX domain-containing protein [Candidatus Paceibacterota bacterium]
MTEKSYGIIPFHHGKDGLEVFLIHQYGSAGDTLWTFPKGRAEEGESPIDTARREFSEETGMTLAAVDEKSSVATSYSFLRKGEPVDKTSTYFIGFVDVTDFSVQPEEVKEAGWFTIPDARLRLTFPDYKKLLDEALTYLDN